LTHAPQQNLFLSKAEFDELIEAMPDRDAHYKEWFTLAFVSGLRLSEQYNLRTSQIVKINGHWVIKVGMIESGLESKTKTESPRMVIIEKADEEFITSLVCKGSDYLFPKRLSDKKSYSKVFKKRIIKYMPHKRELYYHCLRKSYGMYLMADRQRDLGYVQAMLGHQSVLTTQKWYSNYKQLIEMNFSQ
jgi:integrase